MNFSYPTTMYESILAKMYIFLALFTFFFAFYHEKKAKNCKKVFFYQKYVYFGDNTFIHCSRITVVHIHVNVFLLNSSSVSQ